MGTFLTALKKKPLLLGGLIIGAVILIYVVYKSSGGQKNNASQGSGTLGSNANPDSQSGIPGGYLQFEEDVINPTPVNVTTGKTTTKTTKIIEESPPSKRHHHQSPRKMQPGGGHAPPPRHITHIKSNVPLSSPPHHHAQVVKVSHHTLNSPIPVQRSGR